jgi:xanthine dehydrogenase YagT iron-sulfur-binding subunit
MELKGQYSRRSFLKVSGLLAGFMAIPSSVKAFYQDVKQYLVPKKNVSDLRFPSIKKSYPLCGYRTTLLDLFREQLNLTGSKKAVTTDNVAPVPSISVGKEH